MAKLVNNFYRIGHTTQSYIVKNKKCFSYLQLICNMTTRATNEVVGKRLTYAKTNKLYKISKKHTMNMLQELFPVREFIIAQILENNKQLYEVAPIVIKSNYKTCVSYGILNETIIEYTYVLAQKDLHEKLHLLSEIFEDLNETIGLLAMNMYDLDQYVNKYKENKNRIIYLSELLNISPSEMCEHMIKKPFLAKINIDRITDIVKLLKVNGIPDYEIVNDLWALNYSAETVEKRIMFARQNNLERVKTWMIRAPSHILLNYIKIRSENKLILGKDSLAEYLSRRLECSIEHANFIITKLPALKTKSVKKMDETIDYLYGEGLKPVQISSMPKILLHSVETMKERIAELRYYGVFIDIVGLSLLTKTQKQYKAYFNMLVKNNKKKLKGIGIK